MTFRGLMQMDYKALAPSAIGLANVNQTLSRCSRKVEQETADEASGNRPPAQESTKAAQR